MTLEAARAVLRDGTLAIDPKRLLPDDPVLVRADGRTFAQDPPAYDVALAGVGWAVERVGVSSDANPVLFPYLLTLFASAVPTAVAGGLLYRTGRWFELDRGWRFVLALAGVLATGWASYATVLQPHAPATALVVAAVASVGQYTQAKRAGRAVGWLFAGGFCGALALVIEPLAGWALLAVLAAAAVAEVAVRWRVLGVLLVLAGAAGPVTLHGVLNRSIAGDWRPPRWHAHAPPPSTSGPADTDTNGDDGDEVPSAWAGLGRGLSRLLDLTVGTHGLLSHFPVLLLGVAGTALMVRRHWTRAVKAVAFVTTAGLVVTLLYKSAGPGDAIDAGYAAPRLSVFAPVLLLWAGAWLRRRHGAVVWTVSGIALAASVIATVLGAAAPEPAGGYTHYTLAEAAERLFVPTRFGK